MSFITDEKYEKRTTWSGKEPSQPLVEVGAKHHEMARMLVLGATNKELADYFGMSESRISIITHSPAFMDIVERLSEERDKSTKDIVARIKETAEGNALDFLESVLNPERPEYEVVDAKTKVQVAQDFLDRDGRAPRVSRKEAKIETWHVDSDFIAELKASKRSAHSPIDVTPENSND